MIKGTTRAAQVQSPPTHVRTTLDPQSNPKAPSRWSGSSEPRYGEHCHKPKGSDGLQDRASSSLCYICSPSIPPPPSNNVDWSHYLNRFTKHVPLCQGKPLDSRGQKRKKKCLMMTPPTNNEDQQRMKRPLSLSHEAAPTGEERKRKKEKKKKREKKNQLVAQPTSNQPPPPRRNQLYESLSF